MLSQEKEIDTAYFQFVIVKGHSSLLIDKPNKILKVIWSGEVDKDTASVLLTRGADLVEAGSASKLLLNRKELMHFSKGAKNWIKEVLLKQRAKKLVNKVLKVATVKSSSAIGNLFSNVITSAIRMIFPNLKMNQFETEEEALYWLLADQ